MGAEGEGKIGEIYNLEVEGNHNYFADGVLVANCDETAMLRDDEYLLDQVLDPMLATTDGFLIASSTPKGKGSYFWRICKGAFSSEYSQHWVTWREPVEEGLISRGFMEKRLELVEAGLVSRHSFQMEFEAEFVEDTDSWLPYDLITQCIDSERGDPYYDFDHRPEGEFYLGVDLGKKRDHSVIHVIQRQGSVLSLVHKKKFPLESPYASVIGYIKVLRDRADRLRRIYMDQTGVGEYIVEDTRRSLGQGPKDERLVVGVVLTLPKKEAIATHLKTVMENQRTCNRHIREGQPIPDVVRRHDRLLIPYDSELIDELSVEKWELTKAGRVQFSHPEGTHDDEFWALALACAAAREKTRRAVIRKI